MKKLLSILLFVPMFGFCQFIFSSSHVEYNSDSSVFTLNNIYNELIYTSGVLGDESEDRIGFNVTMPPDSTGFFCGNFSINFDSLPEGFNSWHFNGLYPTQSFSAEDGGSITIYGSTPYIGQYNINYTIETGISLGSDTCFEITFPYAGGVELLDILIGDDFDIMNQFLPELVMNIEPGNPILGCTNFNYVEYNPLANVDDGNCQTAINSLYLYSLIDSLSNQLQNLQESLIIDTIEEELVSDANSFDVLNPLSYNGEFEIVDFSGPFTVPSGKTLVIQHIHNTNSSYENLSINSIDVMRLYNSRIGSNQTVRDFEIPIIVGSGNVVSSLSKIFGILIDRNYHSVTHKIGETAYSVPDDKVLIITHFYDESGNNLYIDNDLVAQLGAGTNSGNITIPFYINSNSIIEAYGTNWPEHVSMHGILIDNSNYTYTTDYELIDALNEGMDSLSTLSEDVALENDSISSQNAILSQENEALMAIDYNFDSLQYVADYLSTQVFDLQQELLVTNIEVDMDIGWNMIGFSCPVEKELTDALNEIVDEVLIMKNNNGSVFMPEFSFNGIGDLTPGHGYQIKVADYILDFNICE